MTYRELYLTARRQLDNAGIDAPGADAAALLEHFFGLTRPGLAVHGDELPEPAAERGFLDAVQQRAQRRPLQYILGRWEFMGLSLKVGEGVLVPREDTGVLVEAVAQRIESLARPAGLDLCAGTGAVALGICRMVPCAEITCVEVSPIAFRFLEENLAAYPDHKVRALQEDVLLQATAARFADGSLDFIAANPPYIARDELPTLQPEVQKEPALALDGGEDGLLFYRAIAALWVPKVKPGGVVAVEIGEEQGEAVVELLRLAGVEGPTVLKDWAGLPRCVIGTKK